jgi:chromosome segregation ATPase
MAAAPFVLTGIGAVTLVPVLGAGFWAARKRENAIVAEIQKNVDMMESVEAKMDEHQRRLENIVPQIGPVVEYLQNSTTATRAADQERRASIEEMRANLSALCTGADQLVQGMSKALQETSGARDENAVITAESRKLASASAFLQSEAERHESIVNAVTEETTRTIIALADAISEAEYLIRQANSNTEDTA